MKKNYDLRCCFDYVNRKSWFSQWNKTIDTPTDAAYRQPKDGLIYAYIEGKNIITRQTTRLVECKGVDFCTFQWIATTSTPAIPEKLNKLELSPNIIGLILVSRYKNITVYMDGTIYIDDKYEKQDTGMHYAR